VLLIVIHAGEQVVWYENRSLNESYRLNSVYVILASESRVIGRRKCSVCSLTNYSLFEVKGRWYFLNYL
jgi:hypothetical protein